MAANDIQVTGLQEYPLLRYTMGFCIEKVPIPDPSVFTGAESDLDTMGERDATGYLHRNMVATKHPLKLEYHNIPWDTVMDLGKLLRKDKFNFSYPSPFTGEIKTMDAYVGDREFEAVWAPDNGIWIANLKFSVIEY